MRQYKFLSLLLAVLLLLAACGTAKPAGESGAESGSSQKNTEKSKSSGPLDVMMWARDSVDFQSMEYYKDLEEKTGISSNLTTILGDDWSTKTNLMFASGDYPDILLRGGVDLEMYGVDQKIIQPLDDAIQNYMPLYQKLLEPEPEMLDYMRASDGQVYYTGWLVPQKINLNSHLFVNKNWLEHLDLAVPTTLDEFEAMLIAFKDKDPNQNGQADEVPFTGQFGGMEDTRYLLSFWGIPHNDNWIAIDDEQKVYSPLQDENLRPAMETLHRWYSQGLMDIESITSDLTAYEAKVNSGIAGSFWRWRMIAMSTPEEIYKQYEGILPVPALDGVSPKLTQRMELPSFGAAVTVACDDVETACTWLDAQYDVEMQLNGYYGKYKEEVVDGAEEKFGWTTNDDGKYEFFTADLEECPNQSALHFFTPTEYFEQFDLPEQRIEKTELCEMYTDAGMVEKYSASILTSLVKLSLEEAEQRDLLKAEISKFADESLVNFITSGVTDESWNTYLSNLENLKISEYITLYQTAYNRYLEVLGD